MHTVKNLITTIAAIFYLLFASVVYAQNPRTVLLRESSRDCTLCDKFFYEIREQLARSATLKQATDNSPNFTVYLTAMQIQDTPGPGDGNRLAYSLAISAPVGNLDAYRTSSVGVCGSLRLESCARGIMATISSAR